MATALQFKPCIVSTGQSMFWRQAWHFVGSRGGLPLHRIADDFLVPATDANRAGAGPETKGHRGMDSSLFWVAELLVCPPRGGVFRSGESIYDPRTDMVFPAEHIPSDAREREGAVLLVLPKNVSSDFLPSRITIDPKLVQVAHPSLPHSGMGRVDSVTRLPLSPGPGQSESLDYSQARFLGMPDHPEPLVRPLGRNFSDPRSVLVTTDRFEDLAPAYVAYDLIEPGADTGGTDRELVRAVSIGLIQWLARDNPADSLRDFNDAADGGLPSLRPAHLACARALAMELVTQLPSQLSQPPL